MMGHDFDADNDDGGLCTVVSLSLSVSSISLTVLNLPHSRSLSSTGENDWKRGGKWNEVVSFVKQVIYPSHGNFVGEKSKTFFLCVCVLKCFLFCFSFFFLYQSTFWTPFKWAIFAPFLFFYLQGSTIHGVSWPWPLSEGYRPEYDQIRTLWARAHKHTNTYIFIHLQLCTLIRMHGTGT